MANTYLDLSSIIPTKDFHCFSNAALASCVTSLKVSTSCMSFFSFLFEWWWRQQCWWRSKKLQCKNYYKNLYSHYSLYTYYAL